MACSAFPRVVLGMTIALAMTQAVEAQHAPAPDEHGALGLRWDSGPKAHRATLAAETPPLWSHRSARRQGHLKLTGVAAVSYWHATHERQPASAWQLSATPLLRWWPRGEGFYMDGGIGMTVFSHTHLAGTNISTAFQFGSHLGVGYQITPAASIGVGVSHFSNARIKEPNPGFTLLRVSYTYRL